MDSHLLVVPGVDTSPEGSQDGSGDIVYGGATTVFRTTGRKEYGIG